MKIVYLLLVYLYCSYVLIITLQIYVEVERARLSRILAQIFEEQGNVAEAANVLQELQVCFCCIIMAACNQTINNMQPVCLNVFLYSGSYWIFFMDFWVAIILWHKWPNSVAEESNPGEAA